MLHLHTHQNNEGIFLYCRKYLGGGKYYQRGVFPGMNEGDEFKSFTAINNILKVDKIVKVSKSKATGEETLIECELSDPGFTDEKNYTRLFNIGRE